MKIIKGLYCKILSECFGLNTILQHKKIELCFSLTTAKKTACCQKHMDMVSEEKLYVNAFVFPPKICAFACSSFLFARKSFVPLRNFAIKIGGVEGKTINAF